MPRFLEQARASIQPERVPKIHAETAVQQNPGLLSIIETMPDDPVDVIIMPEFQRGVSVAYLDPPGPLDVGQKAYRGITCRLR